MTALADRPGSPAPAELHEPVLAWYARNARDLPWRAAGVTPWGVLVSEVMLQQTPVARVLPAWTQWLRRWPSPGPLAAASPADAVRAWGRLGYPRRALRLHATAGIIADQHGGRVPGDVDTLRTLPGIGPYTAAAVAAFAFGRRHAVVDTNVRRVLARLVLGAARPAPALTAAETRLAAELLPVDEDGHEVSASSRWSVAVMELGALVCTARSPRCAQCPVARRCRWRLAGRPSPQGPVHPGQSWHGTDRQVRGRLLAVLRDHDGPVPAPMLAESGDDPEQCRRALASLVADGLAEATGDGRFQLPQGTR